MENLKTKIAADYVAAFKSGEKVKKNLLGVIKGAITTEEKKTNTENLSDADVSKILKSVYKGIKETIEQADSSEARTELAVIESYLPQQMSEEEIRTAIEQVISETGATSPAEMGKVMGGFNAKFAGKADGKIVSGIVKELLAVKA